MMDMNLVSRIDEALAPMCKAIGEKVQAAGDAIIEAFDSFMNKATAVIAEKTVAMKDGFNRYASELKTSFSAQETLAPNTPAIKKEGAGPSQQQELGTVADKLPQHDISKIDKIRASLESSYAMPAAMEGVHESELGSSISASPTYATNIVSFEQKSASIGIG